MGKRWRNYSIGNFRLGVLFDKKRKQDEAVVCWRDEGGRHRHRLGAYSEGEGRTALERFVGRFEALRARDSQTLGDIFKAYRSDRAKDGKLVAAFDYNWRALEPSFGSMQVADLTADACRQYLQHRMHIGRTIVRRGQDGCPEIVRHDVGVGTVWTELMRLRSALNWAEQRGLVEKAPYVWVPTKPQPRGRVLSEDELVRLIDACVMPHIRVFVVLAITTAGRSAAILELSWDRVDFVAGTIDLRVKEEVNPLTKKVRKGRSLVVMTEEARAVLLEAKTGALTERVVEWDASPVRKIRKGFQAAVQRAGLGVDVTPHTLRHTVLTWLDEAGIPMERISRLAGHRDINTTRTTYAKPRVETLQPAAAVIDLRMRRNRTATDSKVV